MLQPRSERRGGRAGERDRRRESLLPQGPKRKNERRRKMERSSLEQPEEERGILYWVVVGGAGRLSATAACGVDDRFCRAGGLRGRLRFSRNDRCS